MESWAAVMAPMYYFGDAANRQKNPPEFAMLKIGTHAVCPTNLAHMVVGAALVGGMLVLRGLFAWWPLHPFGFIFCSTWAIQRIWFSILIGWLCKTCVMGFGGAPAYRRILPFFIGLAIGECTISVILTVAAATGSWWLVERRFRLRSPAPPLVDVAPEPGEVVPASGVG